jgi:hypothetical protein
MGVSGQHRLGRAFPPGKGPPSTHWLGGWVGLRAGLDARDRRKILFPCRGSNLDRPIVQPVVRHYTASYRGSKYSLTDCNSVRACGWRFKSSASSTAARIVDKCFATGLTALIRTDLLVFDMAWSKTGTCLFKISYLRGLLLKKLYIC